MNAPLAKLAGNEHLFYQVADSRAHFLKKVRRPTETVAQGQFDLLLDIMCLQEPLYIPLSLASGKKPTGFVYHIEGTDAGALSTATVSCRGEGVTQITLGTLRYAKVPTGKTAHFKMIVHIEGQPNKEYKVVLNQINYKLDPSAARYKKLGVSIPSKPVTFRN